MINIYEQVSRNKTKSIFIILGFIGFITGLTYLFYVSGALDLSFVGLALIFSGSFSFISYWFSDKIILGISKAKPANKQEHFDFYTVAENLALATRLPTPKLYVINDSAMNAFATGRDSKHAVICVTTGLLSRLNRTELEGVVAHELSHIRNYDMLLMSLVTILVGLVTLLADWLIRSSFFGGRSRRDRQSGSFLLILALIMALLSPLIANLIKLAISRRREYLADASAVAITKQPSGLLSALKKLAADRQPLEVANKATAHLYITNPLKNLHSGVNNFAKFFNTHPPIQKRITELEKML
jgi:heat shock protein HtpX